jgi:transposase InsO family protein
MDVKHLPKLQDRDGVSRKRYLYVAIDRASRYVHLAVKEDETTASAVAFLEEAVLAFPFRVTHVLTDRGSCFVADAFEAACRKLKVEHRTTRPYTPRTNGMVERFNGRVQREVLGITIHSHRDLETVLSGFNRAYNGRRQRVLKGRSPTWSCASVSPPSRAGEQTRQAARSGRTTPELCNSSQSPRRSHIQTASTTVS